MPENPYVGVTGITDKYEAKKIAEIFRENGFPTETHSPMAGILISDSTLKDKPLNKRYAKLEEIPDTLRELQDAFTTLHYGTTAPEFAEKIFQFFNYRDIYDNGLCRAVQLNIDYPSVDEVRMIEADYPRMKFIMPVTAKVITENTNAKIAKTMSDYPADYILIDASGGQGRSLKAKETAALYKELKHQNPKATICIAGGLGGPDTYEKIRELAMYIGSKDFGIDSESKVREKVSDKWGDDVLSMEMMDKYAGDARAAFMNFNPLI